MTGFVRNRFPVPLPALLLIVICELGWVPDSSAEQQAVSEAGQTSGRMAARENREEAQESGPRVRLGEPARPREREAVISVTFTPRREEPAGNVHAELTLPAGPWRFQRAEAPPRSGLRVSARQRRLPSGATQIELSVSSGRRTIPEGPIGNLRFRLDEPSSPLPAGLSVSKVETSAPETADSPPLPDLPPAFADPPFSPGMTCFFFTH